MSRWTREQLGNLLGFDPDTLEWLEGVELTHRATISGDINGFPVQILVYDEDLAKLNDDGQIVGLSEIEVGVFQYFTSQMLEHGIQPAYRRRTDTSDSNETSQSGAQSSVPARWKCPEHGDQFVYPNNFDKTKLQCKTWVSLQDSPNQPSWAQNKVATVNGQPRWYCRHKE